MGWNAKCECGHLRVVDTYGGNSAMCKMKRNTFCYAAEPSDETLKEWIITKPEHCVKEIESLKNQVDKLNKEIERVYERYDNR
jgi:hypothetical protein